MFVICFSLLIAAPAFAQKSKKRKPTPTANRLPTYNAPLYGDPNNRGMDYSYEQKRDLIIIHYIYPGICEKLFSETYSKEIQEEEIKKLGYAPEKPNFLITYPAIINKGPDGSERPPTPSPDPIAYFVGGPDPLNPNDFEPNCFKSIVFKDIDQMQDARMHFFEKVFDSPDEAKGILDQEKDKRLTSDQRLAIALASLIDAVDKRINPTTEKKEEDSKDTTSRTTKNQ